MAEDSESTDAGDSSAAVGGRGGIALASMTLGIVGLVVAVSAWAAWFLIILPSGPDRWTTYGAFAYTTPGLITIGLGLLWLTVLPVSVLAMVYGRIGQRSGKVEKSETGDLATIGVVTGIIALLLALAGAAVFTLSNDYPGPPAIYMDEPGKLPEPATTPHPR